MKQQDDTISQKKHKKKHALRQSLTYLQKAAKNQAPAGRSMMIYEHVDNKNERTSAKLRRPRHEGTKLCMGIQGETSDCLSGAALHLYVNTYKLTHASTNAARIIEVHLD